MYWVKGDKQHVSEAFYCPFCYRLLEQRATAAIPGLIERSGQATMDELSALLHITPDKEIRKKEAIVAWFPADMIKHRKPFTAFYLSGDELQRHIEGVRKKLVL